MEIFCTVKSAIDSGDTVECSVFMLQRLKLEPGMQLDQRRDTGEGPATVASWEFIRQTDKSIILKKGDLGADFIEPADGFYAPIPVKSAPAPQEELPMSQEPVSKSENAVSVLMFAGKNWKWVPTNLDFWADYAQVGELTINGKAYTIFKLAEGFAAKEKVS